MAEVDEPRSRPGFFAWHDHGKGVMADTIYALSSGVGRAALAVVRVSGPATRFVLETMVAGVPPVRRAVLRRMVDPISGELVDEGLVLFFPGPRSYTGEDMAEFHIHGGRAVVQAALTALAGFPMCRLAEPGEFTRRALANGRLDLARVEGIGDLIAAETPQQRRQALAQASGALSSKVEAWREVLLGAMAQFEALIDFSDEGDVQDQAAAVRTLEPLSRLSQEIADVLADGRRGEIVRDGFVVVIAGPPNAGKSTLLNALARRDVAIVSDVPGTTRDVLQVHLDLGGYPVTLLDTAGIRETADRVEAIGVQRAEIEARRADLVLWLSPAMEPVPAPESWDVPLLTVTSQVDSCPEQRSSGLAISALVGTGISDLIGMIGDHASRTLGGEPALVTRERHRLALEQTLAALARAMAAIDAGSSPEMPAEDLRLAARSLGQIIGAVDVEDVLDTLFGSFCIGK